jgi:hypothetical protein
MPWAAPHMTAYRLTIDESVHSKVAWRAVRTGGTSDEEGDAAHTPITGRDVYINRDGTGRLLKCSLV